MRIRRAFLVSLALVLLPAGAAAAQVTPAAITVDDREPKLEADGDGDGDGDGWKVSVGLTNLTNDEVNVDLTRMRPDTTTACSIKVDGKPRTTAVLEPATHGKIGVTWSAACKAEESGVAFYLTPRVTPAQRAIRITASKKASETADWTVLVAFPIGWILGLLGLAAATKTLPFATGPKTALKHLPSTWSFSDSWASNITVLGGLLTGIVGSSETVKAILGEEADTALARATVGVAVAAALVGVAAVILQTCKSQGKFTIGGLVVVGAFVVAAASGELLVVWQTGLKLALGGVEDYLWIGVILLLLLLAVYSARNLRATIRTGLTDRGITVPESAVVATALVSSGGRGTPDVATLLASIDAAFATQAAREKDAAEAAESAQQSKKAAKKKRRGVAGEVPADEQEVESAPVTVPAVPVLAVAPSASRSAALL